MDRAPDVARTTANLPFPPGGDGSRRGLQQLRDALDTGTTTDKIQQMRQYLEVVEEKLSQEEDKVKRQKLAVEQAEIDLKNAQETWRQFLKEVDKLQEHRKM